MKLSITTALTTDALAALMQRCTTITTNPLPTCRQIHAVVLTATSTATSPPFLNNNLITLYARSDSIVDARLLFDTMPVRNHVSYSAIISACSRVPNYAAEALRFLPEMLFDGFRPNGLAIASLLHAASAVRDWMVGCLIHSLLVKDGFGKDGAVRTALLTVYAECGFPAAANRVFDEMRDRDVIAWNAVIVGNLKNGELRNGLRVFCSMMRSDDLVPSEYTFSMVLSACRRLGDRSSGRIVHALVTKLCFLVDVPLQNALLDMYCSCRDLGAAMTVFKEIELPVLVSWNTLISGYSDNGDADTAVKLFRQLRAVSSGQMYPDEYTYAAVVSGTASLQAKFYGKPLHAQLEKVGLAGSIYVGSTLIDMYFNNQESDSASKVFTSISDRDAIVWTGMIVGHSRSGEGEQSLIYFRDMMRAGHKVDSFSLSSSLNSSADLSSLKQGETIHSQAVKTGYKSDICVSGSLIDMYAKNGDLRTAHLIFSRVEQPDLKCWNAMLGGYGNHGDPKAFELLDGIIRSGLQPDQVTFVSLLSACSHQCLVERGRHYWNYMIEAGVLPGKKHYACMVNLLSRTGRLQEAEELILASPFANEFPELWRILLSSCVGLKELGIGLRAADRVLMLEEDDSSTLVMVSNLYASVGRWVDVSRIRRRIREMMVDKDPGLSWVEIKDRSHVFSADDGCHEKVDEAREELIRLQGNMKGSEKDLHEQTFFYLLY